MIITKSVVRLIQGPLFAKLAIPFSHLPSESAHPPRPMNFARGGLFTQCDYYHSHPLSK